MSEFKEFWISDDPETHLTRTVHIKNPKNIHFIHVIEYAALEAAQKRIDDLQENFDAAHRLLKARDAEIHELKSKLETATNTILEIQTRTAHMQSKHAGKLNRYVTAELLMTKLTTKEMLIALAEGKKVRKACWAEQSYVYLFAEGSLIDENNHKFNGSLNDNWELYEEPVKPARWFKYDYSDGPGRVWRADRYYLDDADFKKAYPAVEWFQKRENDWTEL